MAEKILFFFSALGVFNALLLGIYILLGKENRQESDYFLGALLLCLVIRVAVSCFHFFGPVSKESIKLGLAANLLLGPLVLFLMKALIDPNNRIIKDSLRHLGFWALTLIVAWFSFDFPTWNWKVRFVIHFALTVYLVITALIFKKEIEGFLIKKNTSFKIRKAVTIFLSLVLICLGFVVSLFSNYILGPLSFSVIFYLSSANFLLNKQKEKKLGPGKKIDQGEFNEIKQKLTQLMEVDKLYKNPDLKLDSLASKLSISRHLLSQVLNDKLRKNFHQYINDYRIEEACRILKENKPYSIEAIGHEVGFNSRSSFFAAFKKKVGMTPSKYREES